MVTAKQVLSGLMGVCVGDALGVPVEFTSRVDRTLSPVTSMQGGGTWCQPPGTWSDDSSLTLCLAASLCEGFSLDAIAHSFYRWYSEGYWGAHGEVFDIGNTTLEAIMNWHKGASPETAGGSQEYNNGNGSLMRILPMAYFYQAGNFQELIEKVHQVSCITHGHLRSQMACGIYISIAIELLTGFEPNVAYLQGLEKINALYSSGEYALEKPSFDRVFSGEIAQIPIEEINSSGYVVDTLEASLWCLLNSSSYAQAVLKAVNLGGDTDTTGAVTGGLAGIYYGWESIPNEWLEQIARKQDIMDLASRLSLVIS
ncbi:ADP-ribosylglycohydrolase family protein [Okeanomitos corallinicola TIOX110]|uniref:ADP-ribosylglycohydrolase family protein n=1 Tax=Okeanomitos corallinicola TIOX110 TaxID=3133117 RepID=A0ABZ2UPI2_9CYAN